MLNGDQLIGRPTYRVYSCAKNGASVYVKNIQAQIAMKTQDIRRLENEKLATESAMAKAEDDIKVNKSLDAANDASLSSLRKQLSNLNYVRMGPNGKV